MRTVPDAVIHEAAEPEGMQQRCARCGVVLIDREGEVVFGDTRPLWWAGRVSMCGGMSGTTDEPATCVARVAARAECPRCGGEGNDGSGVRCEVCNGSGRDPAHGKAIS